MLLKNRHACLVVCLVLYLFVLVRVSSGNEGIQIFTGEFHENSCEVRDNVTEELKGKDGNRTREICMSCTLIIAQEALQEGEPMMIEPYTKHHRLHFTERIYCEDLNDNSTCVIKPEIRIATPNKTKTREQAKGFEIIITQMALSEPNSWVKTNTEIFVEVKISSFKFVDLGYPDVVVDFVPGFNFKPSSKYAFVLNTLPKQRIGSGGDMNSVEFSTHELPSQQTLDSLSSSIESWPQKEDPQCTNPVFCFRGEGCNMDSGASLGTAKSFLIAVSVSILFLVFFGIVVATARLKARKLGRDDTEFLYDEDDDDLYDEEHVKRTNDTEMATINPANANQNSIHQPQTMSSLSSPGGGYLEEPSGSKYTIGNGFSSDKQNPVPDNSAIIPTFATSEFGKD